MRRGYDQGIIVTSDKQEFVGFCLGGDACAEHEMGITELKLTCKMPPTFSREALGIAARVSGKINEADYLYRDLDDKLLLVVRQDAAKDFERYIPNDLIMDAKSSKLEHGFVGAWDEDGFAILVDKNDKPASDGIQMLYSAVQAGNISFVGLGDYEGFSGTRPSFLICGLSVVVADKIPAHVCEALAAHDAQCLNDREEWEKSGVEQELRVAGCQWYGLGNRFCRNKKGELLTWLNPMEQQKYKYGWFTVAQLREWAQGTGPIMMTKEKKHR